MADPPKTTAHLYPTGLLFFNAKPLPDEMVIDLMISLGLGNFVAAYWSARSGRNVGPDLDNKIRLKTEAACYCTPDRHGIGRVTHEPREGISPHIVGVVGCAYTYMD